MTDKKEQARKLREAADVLSITRGVSLGLAISEMKQMADELDPPVHERWERVRCAAYSAGYTPEPYWKAVLTEADKGMVSKDELRRLAPWFSGASGSDFSPSSYDAGIFAFLRVMDSL
jgi:hypothetical protein